jgi:hypothetical protein
VDDLELKELCSIVSFTEREVCAPGFITSYLDASRRSAPLVAFLTRVLGLRW